MAELRGNAHGFLMCGLSDRLQKEGDMKTPGKRVLLVDDELSVSSSLSDLLELWGYEVCSTVTSGEDAILTTRSEKPDLVLMDIQLKGSMNGIESAREIKKHNNASIIFMTGYISEKLKREAEMLRPLAYLTKPFELDELKSALDSASQAK